MRLLSTLIARAAAIALLSVLAACNGILPASSSADRESGKTLLPDRPGEHIG